MVVYKPLYKTEFGKELLWARPKVMFEEIITRDGKTFPRFDFIEE